MQDDRDKAELGRAVYHNRCGDVAFRWAPGFFPDSGATSLHSVTQMTHKDGRPIQGSDMVACDSCGRGYGWEINWVTKECRAVS